MRAFLLIGSIMVIIGMNSTLKFDLKQAKDIYAYSRPAYCRPEKLALWDCPPCLEHPKMQNLQIFTNSTHDAQGYCGYDAGNNRLVIAIRGTVDLKNWEADLNTIQTDFKACSGCKVHKGFHNVYEDLANNLLACAYQIHSNHPTAQVVITGHSLGAAQSIFAALDINNLIKKVDIYYNFGSPRVGNKAFATYVEQTLSHLYLGRLVHWKDPFSHLPTQAMGFEHYGTEIFLNPYSSEFKECGKEDKTCADQFFWPWQWIINDHLYYYGVCTGCNNTACDKAK